MNARPEKIRNDARLLIGLKTKSEVAAFAPTLRAETKDALRVEQHPTIREMYQQVLDLCDKREAEFHVQSPGTAEGG